MAETIFALSSGTPPAAIGVIRVSGPQAGQALISLAGALPRARHASRCRLCGGDGELLDEALCLWFPGPASATGEDLAEFHVHGGRAVVAAVEAALGRLPGLRRAQPGEFTRRAFVNGRIDLAQAEGLADLLLAETELQRRAAMAAVGGSFSRQVEDWRIRVLELSAEVEAALDFDEADDEVEVAPARLTEMISGLLDEIGEALAAPSAEVLREGFRVALAGPPNAGKSTLFNALVGSEAAITAPVAGTTRDVLVRSVAIEGVPLTFVDMAGLRSADTDAIEAEGIARALREVELADLVLWLGPEGAGACDAWEIDAQCDRSDRAAKACYRHRLSALTGEGVKGLVEEILAAARSAMPKPGQAALTSRQRQHLEQSRLGLREAAEARDLLLVAEGLRQSRAAFDALLGRTATEEVLDTLFARFCIGK